MDCWPLANILLRSNPWGAPPLCSRLSGRDTGARSPRTRPVCRRSWTPYRGIGDLCVRTGAWWAYSGGNWMVARGLPVRRGRCGSRASSSRPFQSEYQRTFCPSGGFRTPGVSGQTAPPGHVREEQGIWLILPVVICLSQRLSHACLSISTLYRETANGSLNQLSFI